VFVVVVALLIALAAPVLADGPPDEAAKEEGEGKKPEEKPGPKPYAEVITDEMTTDDGLFKVHRKDDDVWFEIPAAELGKEMVWVTQIAETQAGYSWAGMPVGDRVVRWERRGDRVLLRDVKYDIRAEVDDPIRMAVQATSVAPIIHAFPVEAWGEDESAVIKVTPLYTTERPEFSAKESLGVGGMDSKRTFIERVKSFPTNIETKVLATYALEKKKPDGAPGRGFPTSVPRDDSQSGVTVLLHHSMVKLPEEPMQPRVWDDRVGFFNVGFADYGDDSEHAVKNVRYVTRWRLEKKDPGKKLSEPVEPIVWYVSREVPKKWQSYAIQGIEDWQPAFEAAGFKNAIVGKLAPSQEEDPDWDPEDARYTSIRWLPSAVPNAFGPHVHDPRTGEILEADVRMFHNVIKLVRDWYFVQASPSDPRAQKLPLPDDLMGELVRFVVAHEVGHSLGLPHNMKASSSYSIEQLRDPEFTRTGGTAPSIMDYARFNYVAQPGDGAALMPRVGKYDHFAIEWGYREFPAAADEQAELEAIVARQVDDPMLRFGRPNPAEDPTQQTEDLGADAVEATRLGLRNLERVAANLVPATSEPGEDYELLENMHGALLGQWARELVHVANVVGGVERINLYYGDADRRFFPVEAKRQREAVTFLNENAFRTPGSFVSPDITRRIEAAGVADRVLGVQRRVLEALLDEQRVKRMGEIAESAAGASYPAADMMRDVSSGVWSDLGERPPVIDLYRRNLQRTHIELLASRLESADAGSDMPALARGELTWVRGRVEKALGNRPDEVSRRHLSDIAARIDMTLEAMLVRQNAPQGGDGNGERSARPPVRPEEPCWRP
jgi:hypothetical protein